MSLRRHVLRVYKQILYLARDWPEGYVVLRDRAKRAFLINREETDLRKIETLIGRAEFVVKEIEALYMLKKYRTLKRRYYKE
ncbi:Electron transfer flavoprotein regulatory factor 1 [Geodia barretti]|uniref:Electron transfer flavoprotein regulatory factor 1 n=1 Tax=Geodia barretti TaxID=519541 RepID=A0AA35TVH2_GEOBA|nr:Electron transfer flavoprotein regulatory factor 1 [Geodia barretti]